MKKIIKYGLLTITILIFALITSCKSKSSGNTINGVVVSDEELAAIEASADSFMTDKNRWVWPDTIKDIMRVSDSLKKVMANDTAFYAGKYWNQEQKKLMLALTRIYVENVELENNRYVVRISREDFVKKGIPEPYYDQLVQSMEDMNFFNKLYKSSPDSTASEWNNTKKEFQRLLDNPE